MRIILPFSPKMPYRRNLGVLWHAAAFLFFPFSGCRSSPSFFSFLLSFLLSPFLRMPSFMQGAFSFFLFSCTTEEKKEKTPVQGREKSVTDDIPETQFFFVFLFFLLFLLSFSFSPCLFPGGFFEKGNPFLSSPFFVGFFVFGKKEKEEERNAANEGGFRIQERKMEGRRDGCSRHPLPVPSGRQNLACDGDFRKRRNSLSCSMKKLPRRQI